MKAPSQQNGKSQLLRRLAGAFEVPLFFWALAVGLGCAVFLLAASLYPLWMQVKPRSSIVTQPLLNTPLESLAPWVAFLLLYVPDMVLLFFSGFFAGWCVRRKWVRWLTASLGAYTILSVAFGGSIWRRAVEAAFQVNLVDLRYGLLCLVVVSVAYAGAFVAIRLRSPNYPGGFCPKCGYSLYGLPSAVCPECGRPFSSSEAEHDDDAGDFRASDNPPSQRSHEPTQRVWITKHVMLARVLVLALLLGVFYSSDWMPLRVAQRDVIGLSLRVSGYNPISFTYEGSPAIRVSDHVFFYTAECTYLDLLMTMAPFLLVFGASLGRNILRIAIVALVILGCNLVRCWSSVYFNLLGMDWLYTHDLPNYIFGIGIVVIAVLGSLRRDFFNHCRIARNDCKTQPTCEMVT